MLELDAYIYDSQFQFLNKDDLLILEYRKSVLNSANCQFIPEINSFLRKEKKQKYFLFLQKEISTDSLALSNIYPQ